mgnify:CR=1 FL=1
MNTKRCLYAVAITFGLVGGENSQAADQVDDVAAERFLFSRTEIQLLHGDGFFLGRNLFNETARTKFTINHFSTWKYGDHFFFIDSFVDHDGPGVESGQYGEFYSHLSLSALTGSSFAAPGIRDIAIGGGVNQGTDFTVALVGARVNLDVPGFSVLTAGVYFYDNIVDPFDRPLDTTYQATVVWDFPFQFSDDLKFRALGFADFIGAQGSGVDSQIVAQPQIRFDVGNLFGEPGRVEVGVEYAYFKNKFGVTGVDDHAVQGLVAIKLH